MTAPSAHVLKSFSLDDPDAYRIRDTLPRFWNGAPAGPLTEADAARRAEEEQTRREFLVNKECSPSSEMKTPTSPLTSASKIIKFFQIAQKFEKSPYSALHFPMRGQYKPGDETARADFIRTTAEFRFNFEVLTLSLSKLLFKDLPFVAAGGSVLAAMHRWPAVEVPEAVFRHKITNSAKYGHHFLGLPIEHKHFDLAMAFDNWFRASKIGRGRGLDHVLSMPDYAVESHEKFCAPFRVSAGALGRLGPLRRGSYEFARGNEEAKRYFGIAAFMNSLCWGVVPPGDDVKTVTPVANTAAGDVKATGDVKIVVADGAPKVTAKAAKNAAADPTQAMKNYIQNLKKSEKKSRKSTAIAQDPKPVTGIEINTDDKTPAAEIGIDVEGTVDPELNDDVDTGVADADCDIKSCHLRDIADKDEPLYTHPKGEPGGIGLIHFGINSRKMCDTTEPRTHAYGIKCFDAIPLEQFEKIISSIAGEIPSVLIKMFYEYIGNTADDLVPILSYTHPRARALRSFRKTDIDLFPVSRNADLVTRSIIELHKRLESVFGRNNVSVIRTKNAVTFNLPPPFRKIQVINRLYHNIEQVLVGFDIDCCAVAYDGRDVWAIPRSVQAIRTRQNIVDPTRQSTTYEQRLYKYARRGFTIAVPGMKNAQEALSSALESLSSYNTTTVAALTGLRRLMAMFHLVTTGDRCASPHANHTRLTYALGIRGSVSDYAVGNEKAQPERNDRMWIPPAYTYGNSIADVLFQNTFLRNKKTIAAAIPRIITFETEMPHRQDRVDALFTGSFQPVDGSWY